MRRAYLQACATAGSVLALLALAGVSCVGPAQRERELQERCKRISNQGIEWDATGLGLWPWVVGKNEKWVLETEMNAEPYLLRALDDPGKWIAAHVLLTKRWGCKHPGYSYENEIRWNGLDVNFLADGSLIIDESQQPAIRQYWIEKLRGGEEGKGTQP